MNKNTGIKNIIKWLVFFILLTVFIYFMISIMMGKELKIDALAHKIIVLNLRSDILTKIMKFLTHFGGGVFKVSICVVALLCFKDKYFPKLITVNLIAITVLNNIIKFIVRRPRPQGFNITIENTYSFPSGHSMISCAFYGLIAYLIYKNFHNKIKRNFICISLILLIVIIGFTRVYLGVHFASDVIGGMLAAICYLICFIEIKKI